MGLNREVVILGNKITLNARAKSKLKGMSVGEIMLYNIYDGSFHDMPLLFVESKKGNPTPRECSITEERLTRLFGLSVVFILKNGPTYERKRLVEKGVYFVMGDQYAFLPNILSLAKSNNRVPAKKLLAVAQYLLLYHLQVQSLESLSPKEISPMMPYSYESVALGITCLTDVGLVKKEQSGQRNKVIHFELRGKDLWNKAQSYLTSPVEQTVYCDQLVTEMDCPICGINALSHYTRLNPDHIQMFMMHIRDYRVIKDTEAFIGKNIFDGNVMIEAWKYPVVGRLGEKQQLVDRLSLALSLREDNDPRVEGEIEYMINNIVWMD